MPHYAPGIYDCQITGQGFSRSKTKDTPFMFLTFMPDGGEYERKIDLWMTEKTVDRLVEWLGQQGISVDKWADLDPENTNHTSMVGMTVQLQCKHEPSQDGSKTYEKWETPMAAKALMPVKPMAASEVRTLDRLFGSALKPLKNVKPVQQPSKPKPAAVTVASVIQDAEDMTEGGEDIPFSFLIPILTGLVFSGLFC